MARLPFVNRSTWMPVAAALLFTAALTALLAYGMRRASELQSASTALQLASELSSQPQLIQSELTLIQRGLETATFIGESLRSVNSVHQAGVRSFQALNQNLAAAGLRNNAAIVGPLRAAQADWQPVDRQLAQLNGVKSSELYADSAQGSQLTLTGRQLKRAVDDLLTRQAKNTRALSDNLGLLASALRATVVRNGANLRILLLTGTALAALLLAMMIYFAMRAHRSAAAARNAQRQVENILGTVREGLFLIGRDNRVGMAHSESLAALLHCPAPAGQSIDDLLRPLVGEKTLIAAIKYVKLLWKEKVHEELIESVNPLSQIEVSFSRPQGGRETRYLSFAFRRARDDSDYLLGVVADITERVMLQQEIEQLKLDHDASGSLLMQLLRIPPAQLESFLGSADQAFRRSNAVLIAPGKEQDLLRSKLDGVFRELHAVKGEAAALGLETFAKRIHGIEDILSTLREQESLSGDQFVPVVTKLDELMSYASDLADARARVAAFRTETGVPVPADIAPSVTDSATQRSRLPTAPMPTEALESLLRSVTAEVSKAHGRHVQLRTEGLELIPTEHVMRIKDICVQMIRNAIVHGIEAPEQRAVAGKHPGGTVRVAFTDNGADEYGLQIEDDGQGLSYEHILHRALQQDMVKPQQAMGMDRAAVFRLIFQPGFSTAAHVSEHAGRGVGLDVVNAAVRECGGRIGISTTAGQFTRFKVLFPKQPAAQSSAA